MGIFDYTRAVNIELNSDIKCHKTRCVGKYNILCGFPTAKIILNILIMLDDLEVNINIFRKMSFTNTSDFFHMVGEVISNEEF